LINRTSAQWAGIIGLVANPIVYGVLTSKWFSANCWPDAWGNFNFLYAMSFSLLIVLAIMTVYGLIWKQQKVVFAHNTTMDLTSSKGALAWGLAVCAMTVALYVIFW